MSEFDADVTRRLTTILAADVVGYSRLMSTNETRTLADLKSHRAEVLETEIARLNGRIIKHLGDGLLAEFPSVHEAVECAINIQTQMKDRNAEVAEDRAIRFRIGINLGDMIIDEDDIYGDGVNIAARLEGAAPPGGICISRHVKDQIGERPDIEFEELGRLPLKNVGEVHCFAWPAGQSKEISGRQPRATRKLRMLLGAGGVLAAVLVAVLLLGDGNFWRSFQAKAAQPDIAVLPFENMSARDDQEYFSDGITADLINELSRISGMNVIARSTMFTYKNSSKDARQVGRDLGVAYVLEGSIQRAGNDVRINVQLIEAETSRQLWSVRYDRNLANIFEVQDEITEQIVDSLSVRLTGAENASLKQTRVVDPDAYDLLLRGLENYRRYTQATNSEARNYFRAAIAKDADFARAHAGMALTYYNDALNNWSPESEAIEQAYRWALSALALDSTLPQVYFALCDVYRFQKRFDEAIDAAEKAIELDPNYADGYAILGLTLIYAGQFDRGLEAAGKAVALNPRPPFFYYYNLSLANYLAEDFEAAAEHAEDVLDNNPHFLPARLLLAATYAKLDRPDDAAWEIGEALSLSPNLTIEREAGASQFKNETDLENYLDGLRKARLPLASPT